MTKRGLNAVRAAWKVFLSTEHRSPVWLEIYAGPKGDTVIEFKVLLPQLTLARLVSPIVSVSNRYSWPSSPRTRT